MIDINQYAKECHEDIVANRKVTESERSTVELLCSRVLGLLDRVAELEGDAVTHWGLIRELQAQLDRAKADAAYGRDLAGTCFSGESGLIAAHGLKDWVDNPEQLDRATEPRVDGSAHE